VQAPKDMPLVLTIKDIVGLTGNKFVCGVSQFDACFVLMNGNLSKYCSIYVSDIIKKEIFTTE
jgi:isoquinoline 1-oxidoreductase alpha subunit